jgi:hypothetical protein
MFSKFLKLLGVKNSLVLDPKKDQVSAEQTRRDGVDDQVPACRGTLRDGVDD